MNDKKSNSVQKNHNMIMQTSIPITRNLTEQGKKIYVKVTW